MADNDDGCAKGCGLLVLSFLTVIGAILAVWKLFDLLQ